MNFKATIREQDYKPNTEASICRNCANMEQKQAGFHQDGKTKHMDICGVGRFYVKSFGTCRMFEEKAK